MKKLEDVLELKSNEIYDLYNKNELDITFKDNIKIVNTSEKILNYVKETGIPKNNNIRVMFTDIRYNLIKDKEYEIKTNEVKDIFKDAIENSSKNCFLIYPDGYKIKNLDLLKDVVEVVDKINYDSKTNEIYSECTNESEYVKKINEDKEINYKNNELKRKIFENKEVNDFLIKLKEDFLGEDYFKNEERVNDYLKLKKGYLEYEEFGIITLDKKNKIIDVKEKISSGTIDRAIINEFQVFNYIQANDDINKVIFFHNHPSGDTTFSYADEYLTNSFSKKLKEIYNIKEVDHKVITKNEVNELSKIIQNEYGIKKGKWSNKDKNNENER